MIFSRRCTEWSPFGPKTELFGSLNIEVETSKLQSVFPIYSSFILRCFKTPEYFFGIDKLRYCLAIWSRNVLLARFQRISSYAKIFIVLNFNNR